MNTTVGRAAALAGVAGRVRTATLPKLPPTLRVPAPVKVTLLFVAVVVVRLPEMVAVPVLILRSEVLLLLPPPLKVRVFAVTVPAPTARVVVPLALGPVTVMVPVTVRELVLAARVTLAPVTPAVELMVIVAALAANPVGIVTGEAAIILAVSPAVG